VNTLNCLHCGHIVERGKYLQINIEATRGPRIDASRGKEPLQANSPYPTRTMAILCVECLWRRELEPILRLISPPLSEVSMHAGDRCVVLCRGRKEFFLFPWVRRRMHFWPGTGMHKCPLCGRVAVCWPAQQSPSRYSREAQELIESGGAGRVWSRRPVSARDLTGVTEE
jgi:hypothetical protein